MSFFVLFYVFILHVYLYIINIYFNLILIIINNIIKLKFYQNINEYKRSMCHELFINSKHIDLFT